MHKNKKKFTWTIVEQNQQFIAAVNTAETAIINRFVENIGLIKIVEQKIKTVYFTRVRMLDTDYNYNERY